MQCLRNSLNGILFFLLYFDAVSCFYEEKQQDEYTTTAILNITFCDALKKNCHSESGDGKFGLNSPKEHVSGWLVLLNADNHNGCKSFSRTVSPELKPTIVLLIRGDCNFKDKISNAYKYNASAVVIYNNQGKDKAVSMSHAGEYHIVSVSVSQISGEKLASKLQNATVYVEINVGQQRTRPKWKVNPTSVLFVSVSFIVLMVISLAWLVFYYVQRFRYVHARDKTEVSSNCILKCLFLFVFFFSKMLCSIQILTHIAQLVCRVCFILKLYIKTDFNHQNAMFY